MTISQETARVGALRSYGYLRVSTASSHTSFAIYGDPDKDTNKSITFTTVLAVAVRIAATGAQPTHADPVGPSPVPPVGAAFGPPGWVPRPEVGSPPAFANTHGPTDSRGIPCERAHPSLGPSSG
jgi:hypothetical protein